MKKIDGIYSKPKKNYDQSLGVNKPQAIPQIQKPKNGLYNQIKTYTGIENLNQKAKKLKSPFLPKARRITLSVFKNLSVKNLGAKSHYFFKLEIINASLLIFALFLSLAFPFESPKVAATQSKRTAQKENKILKKPIVPAPPKPQMVQKIKQTISVWSFYSYQSFWQNKDLISEVLPFWYELDVDQSSIKPKTQYLPMQEVQKIQKEGKKVIPTFNGDPKIISAMLANASKRETCIKNLINLVLENNFDGIDLDFEGLIKEDRNNFNQFADSLSKAFHQNKKILSVTLEARIRNQVPLDWEFIGKVADRFSIMGYDYHPWETGWPGPIGPEGWLEEVLDYALSVAPKEKIVLGIGNYGYDWVYNSQEGIYQGRGLTFDQIQNLILKYKPEIKRANVLDLDRFYATGPVPHFEYLDEGGIKHFVWYEDSQSIESKLALVKERGIRGVSFWRLDNEDPKIWGVVKKWLK